MNLRNRQIFVIYNIYIRQQIRAGISPSSLQQHPQPALNLRVQFGITAITTLVRVLQQTFSLFLIVVLGFFLNCRGFYCILLHPCVETLYPV